MTPSSDTAAPWIAPDLSAKLNLLSESTILALTLYGEASSEPIEGQVGVGQVVQHRATDSKHRWPRTVREVCLQPSQFSTWNTVGGSVNFARLMRMVEQIAAGTDPKNPAFEQCAWVALGLTKGALFDRVKGSNHYHTVAMMPRPAWAPSVPTCQCGSHLFYAIA